MNHFAQRFGCPTPTFLFPETARQKLIIKHSEFFKNRKFVCVHRRKTTLNQLDLLPKGEVHAIMGPNGSGKSTLSKVLAGHPEYQPSEGSALLDGEEILGLEPDKFQDLGFFFLSISRRGPWGKHSQLNRAAQQGCLMTRISQLIITNAVSENGRSWNGRKFLAL